MVDHDDDTSPREDEGQAAPAPAAPWSPTSPSSDPLGGEGERVAKALARAGVASRREVERYIAAGRVALNGKVLDTPAVKVTPGDILTVDGAVVGGPEPTRLFRYHKPSGLITTNSDPQGRPTVFEHLPAWLPRVLAVGRLDLNTEGLLLLTNDGALSRALELPASGWLRRYRARAFGRIDQGALDALSGGVTIDGVAYGPIEARIDKATGHDRESGAANVWISIGITEGKNREVRRVLEHLGLKVNRLIRLAYGPFALSTLPIGEVEEVGPRVIREQLAEHVAPQNLPTGDRAATPPPARAETPARRAGPPKSAAAKGVPIRVAAAKSGAGRGAAGGRPPPPAEGAERRLAETPRKAPAGSKGGGFWTSGPGPRGPGSKTAGAFRRRDDARAVDKSPRAQAGQERPRDGGRPKPPSASSRDERAPRERPAQAGREERGRDRPERPRSVEERPGSRGRSGPESRDGDRPFKGAKPPGAGKFQGSRSGPGGESGRSGGGSADGGRPAKSGFGKPPRKGAPGQAASRKSAGPASAAAPSRTGLELTPPMRRTPRGSGPRRPPRKD